MNNSSMVNGSFTTTVSVDDRGLSYGDGLFETIKVVRGKPEYLSQHLLRLRHGCRRLNIDFDAALISADINSLLAAQRDLSLADYVLKLIVTRGSSGRGYKPDLDAGSQRIFTLTALSSDFSEQQSCGIQVRLCDTNLSINRSLAGLKHLARLENVLARAEWGDKTITEGLMLDTEGRLVEGTMSNIFLLKKGFLLTPSLHRCGVEGIIRGQILQSIGPALALPVSEQDLTVADLYDADEAFICNSLIGVLPIIAIGCHRKALGSVTINIQHALTNGVS